MSKKTIWIFNQYASTPEYPGGSRHIDLSMELIKNNFNVHIFAGSFNHLLLEQTKLNENEKRKIENYQGVTIHWLQTKSYKKNGFIRFWGMILFFFDLLREVKCYKKEDSFEKPDIIIGSSVHLFTVLAAKISAQKFDSKFVMEVRDLWPYTFIATGMMSRHHPIVFVFGWLERYLYRKSDKIISLLQNGNEYIGKYTDKKKVIWIPNSFSMNRLKDLERNIQIDLVQDTQKTTIIYAGSINALDKVELLVKSFHKATQESDKLQLVIIGNGAEKVKLLEYVKNNNLEKYIIFKNSVPKNEILHYLNLADTVWVGLSDSPLYKYGMSFNKIYDYMALAKPILFSGSNYNNPIAESNCALIAVPNNIDSLSEIIIQFHQMPVSEKKELGLKGKKYLIENFTTDIIVNELIKYILQE